MKTYNIYPKLGNRFTVEGDQLTTEGPFIKILARDGSVIAVHSKSEVSACIDAAHDKTEPVEADYGE